MDLYSLYNPKLAQVWHKEKNDHHPLLPKVIEVDKYCTFLGQNRKAIAFEQFEGKANEEVIAIMNDAYALRANKKIAACLQMAEFDGRNLYPKDHTAEQFSKGLLELFPYLTIQDYNNGELAWYKNRAYPVPVLHFLSHFDYDAKPFFALSDGIVKNRTEDFEELITSPEFLSFVFSEIKQKQIMHDLFVGGELNASGIERVVKSREYHGDLVELDIFNLVSSDAVSVKENTNTMHYIIEYTDTDNDKQYIVQAYIERLHNCFAKRTNPNSPYRNSLQSVYQITAIC